MHTSMYGSILPFELMDYQVNTLMEFATKHETGQALIKGLVFGWMGEGCTHITVNAVESALDAYEGDEYASMDTCLRSKISEVFYHVCSKDIYVRETPTR